MKSITLQFKMVPLDTVVDGYQLRLSMNLKDIHSLAESIKAKGMLQPVGVARMVEGKHESIYGNWRLATAWLAGLKEIPVVIIDSENPKSLAFIENLQRKKLNARESANCLYVPTSK